MHSWVRIPYGSPFLKTNEIYAFFLKTLHMFEKGIRFWMPLLFFLLFKEIVDSVSEGMDFVALGRKVRENRCVKNAAEFGIALVGE